MSVVEADKIDGLGINKDQSELNMLITDHLDWQDEQEHLLTLQDKINAYIGFVEAEQYKEIYPEDTFESFVLEIHFKYEVPENCLKFLDVVANQVDINRMKVRVHMAECKQNE